MLTIKISLNSYSLHTKDGDYTNESFAMSVTDHSGDDKKGFILERLSHENSNDNNNNENLSARTNQISDRSNKINIDRQYHGNPDVEAAKGESYGINEDANG